MTTPKLQPSHKIFLIAVLIIAIAAIGILATHRPKPPLIPEYLRAIGADFTLITSKGNVSLSDFRGSMVLIYFGYAHCPDVCPMALTQMGNAIYLLSAPLQKDAHGIFISLDPRRDSPESLSQYASFFGSNMIGATSDAKILSKIAYDWRVDYDVPDAPAESRYSVEHTNFIYLVNRQGQVVALFDERSPAKEIADALLLWAEVQ